MKKNQILEVYVDDIKFPNIGLANVDNKTLQIKGAIPKQKVKIKIEKSRRYKARLLEIIEKSPYEIEPKCPVFGICGGCQFQNIPYNYELEIKTSMVQNLLSPFYPATNFLETMSVPNIEYYRNKMEFSFGDSGLSENGTSELTLGMRKKGSFYEAVDANGCLLCHPDFSKILSFTSQYFIKKGEHFYHRKTKKGNLRHLLIRRSSLGEVLVNLIVANYKDYNEYANELLCLNLAGSIKGILLTTNLSEADVVKPESVYTLFGVQHIMEEVCGLSFKISPFSFFQTNTMAANVLYKKVLELAGNINNKVVFDLYCGTGTISQVFAKYAKKVIGIEIAKEAVASAEESIKYNSIQNCEFIAGDVGEVIKNLNQKPDLIILDPPREGIRPKSIVNILKFNAKEIIYISCKPSSLALDLPHFLEAGYSIKNVQCIDMFARTANIETVVLLCQS